MRKYGKNLGRTIFLALLGKIGPYIGVVVLVGVLLLILGGGGGSGGTPVPPPVSEEKAEEYGIVGSELGVPYDIVMLVNMFLADAEGKDNIEEVNPVFTSLEFATITERREDYERYDYDCSSTEKKTGKVVTKTCSSSKWVDKGTTSYTGKSEILRYINKSESDELAAASVLPLIKQAAEAKSNESSRFTADFNINSDYAAVLEKFPLDKQDRQVILELYQQQYIALLYGEDINIPNTGPGMGGGELPDIIEGKVNRRQLIEVATSIINHPYRLGGKDPVKGKPTRALDCSGFIDWVYIQLFGKSISSQSSSGGAGTAMQFYATEPITEDELQIGDLGFYYDPKDVKPGKYNHVGIYIGKIDGKNAFIHAGGSWFGTEGLPKGRVGISLNGKGMPANSVIPGSDEKFNPPMKNTKFIIFHRPRMQFLD